MGGGERVGGGWVGGWAVMWSPCSTSALLVHLVVHCTAVGPYAAVDAPPRLFQLARFVQQWLVQCATVASLCWATATNKPVASLAKTSSAQRWPCRAATPMSTLGGGFDFSLQHSFDT